MKCLSPYLGLALFFSPLSTQAAENLENGKNVWDKQCAQCHGPMGQGVKEAYKDPLTGDWPIHKLASYIDKNMPEEKPGDCVCKDAQDVAHYMFGAFYSPEAWLRINPPRTTPSHLTSRQIEESLSDVLANLRGGLVQVPKERGLQGTYFNDRNFNTGKITIERVDPSIRFDYGENAPEEGKLGQDAFSVRWQGSLLAEETGWYEISLHSENGCRLWLNEEDDKKLIDGWVASGIMAEHSARIRLLAGRLYPIRIDYFNFKGKTASIHLLWTPPHGTKQIIPERNLVPNRYRATFVPTTPFPPDDTSGGYPRGTLVSRKWSEAAAFAALEAADYVIENLRRFVPGKPEDKDYTEKARKFCETAATLAFRHPLAPEQQEKYIQAPFSSFPAPADAVKRSLLLTFSSPSFLYPNLLDTPTDHYSVASRLSLALNDSLPDKGILGLADRKLLDNPKILQEQARRMLGNESAKTKLQDFFYHWLDLHNTVQLAKDKETYPGFDAAVVADLRTSLQDFIRHIAWETEEADFRQLLQADYFYANQRLAGYYLPGSEFKGNPTAFEPIPLDPGQRAGLLTHPYLLAQFAYARTSSPIHRGVFLTRKVLGRRLQPPPEAVEFEEDKFPGHLTLREKIEKLTSPKNCQGCHSIINPLGFTLENFDAVGRYRKTLGDKAIDTQAPYTTETGKTLVISSAKDIAGLAISSPSAQKAFVKQLFQYYTKQPIEAFGSEAYSKLHQSFVDNKFNLRELIVAAAVLYAQMPDLPQKP